MKVKIRSDSVILDGYVNAVDRYSKPLTSKMGKFIEKILPGAFKRALKRTDNILVLLNHNYDKELASTKDGTAKLYEDNIGLRAEVTIKDKDVIDDAKKGKLRGWSFGFSDIDVEQDKSDDGLLTRSVKDLELYEVSLINSELTPAYQGTSVEMRDDKTKTMEIRTEESSEIQVENEVKELTYNQKSELLNKSFKNVEEKESYINDFDDNYVYVNYFEENQTFKIPYEMQDNENITFDFNNKVKVRLSFVEERTEKSDIYKYQNRLNRLKIM